MSQIGKLYRYYLEKIWQKSWLRIIVFTILIGVVWWFLVPWAGSKAIGSSFQEETKKKEITFAKIAGELFKDKSESKNGLDRVLIRELLENEEAWEEGTKDNPEYSTIIKMSRMGLRMIDSGTYLGIFSTPYSSDNAFFFSQTKEYSEGKSFWKMIFNISWWNLTGIIILYWFIFEVFDKTFFSIGRGGEDTTVLTMTPGVKRTDLIWGKILAFLTFYFLINIVIFLIPFSVYYFWLGNPSYSWFVLLALITVVVGPFLFFCLAFLPYLFFGSLTGQKWIFSSLITFSPLIWGLTKAFSSASWPYKLEKFFFNPIWFIIISLVCGVLFLTFYYLRYQEEDLN